MAESHIRIDEGIKRGPKAAKTRQDRIRRSPKPDLGSWVIPEGLTPQRVLERYWTEESTSQIAGQYGLSRKALVRWLREQCPEEWKQVQVVRALCRKDDGDDGLEVACDALSLARAREQLKSAQWDLERLDSKNYGVKQEVTVKTEEKIELILDGEAQALLARIRPKSLAQGVVIDAHCTAIEPDKPSISDES